MVKYTDYMTTEPKLAGSQEPTNFIRSDFEFGSRQKRTLKNYATYQFVITITHLEMLRFKAMWIALNEGADIFSISSNIHGDLSDDKEVRFTQGFAMQEMGNYKYTISCTLEYISKGNTTPLVPSELLTPSADLVPNG